MKPSLKIMFFKLSLKYTLERAFFVLQNMVCCIVCEFSNSYASSLDEQGILEPPEQEDQEETDRESSIL